MQSIQHFEVDTATSQNGLVDRLLQRLSGSAKYSQLSDSDVLSDRCSQDRWSPEEEATWWSKLTYTYASGLIKLGYSQPLHQEHLWDMAHAHQAVPVSYHFHAAMEATQLPTKAPHVGASDPHVIACMGISIHRPHHACMHA